MSPKHLSGRKRREARASKASHAPGVTTFRLAPYYLHPAAFGGAFPGLPQALPSHLDPEHSHAPEDLSEPHVRPKYEGRAPKGYQRNDERIREDVCDHLTIHPDIDPSDVEVSVEDGIVTFEGTVPTRMMKFQAEHVAACVVGVVDIHNHIRVDSKG